MTDVACPICRSIAHPDGELMERFGMARCSVCSHRFVMSGVDESELADAYGEEYYQGGMYDDYVGSADRRLEQFRQRLVQVEKHAPARGRLLDVGCAVGFFVKVAADAEWNAIGYERSAWAACYGREKLGLDIRVVGDVSNPFPPSSFDVVTCWDVIEHLTDPRGVVESAVRWLKPGGILCMTTIDSGSVAARLAGAEWRHLVPPHHLQFFNKKSLNRLMREAELSVIASRPYGVLRGARAGRVPPGAVGALVERIATHWRMVRIADVLNLLDEVMIVARKT